MLEYLKWRGDLPLTAAALNEVDYLIFTQTSYLHFAEIQPNASFAEAAELLETIPHEPGKPQIIADRHSMLKQLGQSKRFGSLRVTDCADEFDEAREMQFAAITIEMPDGSHVIAYRGTDATIVGWREDFNMGVECPVPSQTEAVRYLESMAAKYSGALRICGHSKGGNLAVYAAACCCAQTRARIAELYSYDGPGLDDATVASEGYLDILPRVRSFVPQTSIVGMLMGIPRPYTVVKSNALVIAQHNTFTWEIDGPQFVTLPEVDSLSVLLKGTLDEFLKQSTRDMRRVLVETLFTVMEAPSTRTIGEMKENPLTTVAAMWKAVGEVDPASKQMMKNVLAMVATGGAESVKQMLTNAVTEKLSGLLTEPPKQDGLPM